MAEPRRRRARRKSRPGGPDDFPDDGRAGADGRSPDAGELVEDGQKTGADTMKAGYAKAEEKNRKVRESLKPLEKDQRPVAVTVGAVFTIIVATIFWASSLVALLTSTKVNGTEPNAGQLIATALIMSLMAWGMWRGRYWAVLGFQMLLVLLIIAAIAGLVVAASLVQVISTLILTIGLSLLFYFMVKAMARIQMPDRLPRE